MVFWTVLTYIFSPLLDILYGHYTIRKTSKMNICSFRY